MTMTTNEIIEMAIQAGFSELDGIVMSGKSDLKAFAKLVALRYEKKIADLENIICQRHWDVLQEREACAMVAQKTVCDTHIPTGVRIYGTAAAKAIRARAQVDRGTEA